MRNRRRGYPLGNIGSSKHSVPLHEDLLDSPAWKALTPLQGMVLIDWYRYYVWLTKWDREPLPEGMTYTWSQCRVQISENAFRDAVKRIVVIGFFDRAPRLESSRPGSPQKYVPSKRWQSWSDDVEAAKAKRAMGSKDNRIARQRERRTQFLKNPAPPLRAGIRGERKRKKEPPLSEGIPPPFNEGIQGGTPPIECGDTEGKSGTSHPHSMRGSDSMPCSTSEATEEGTLPKPSITPEELTRQLAEHFPNEDHPPDVIVLGWVKTIGFETARTILNSGLRNGHDSKRMYARLESMARSANGSDRKATAL